MANRHPDALLIFVPLTTFMLLKLQKQVKVKRENKNDQHNPASFFIESERNIRRILTIFRYFLFEISPIISTIHVMLLNETAFIRQLWM